jgi:hypothetical protein
MRYYVLKACMTLLCRRQGKADGPGVLVAHPPHKTQGDFMNHLYRWALGTLAALLISPAWAASIEYTNVGSPDMSHLVIGQTTYEQVVAALGKPISVSVDTHGTPDAAAFYLPLKGDTSFGGNVVTNTATSAAKTSALGSLSSHMGSLVSHIPGVGGLVAAHAADTAQVQAGTAFAKPNQVWMCVVHFSGGTYTTSSCGTINRPVGT